MKNLERPIIFFLGFLILSFGCAKKQTLTPGGLMDTPQAHYTEGKRLLKLGEVNEARKEFNRAIQLDKKYAPGYEGMGLVYLEMKDVKLSEKYMKKALDLDSEFAPAMIGMGRILMAKGNNKGAIKWFDKGIKIDPTYEEAYIYKADAYVNMKMYNRAEETYNEGMKKLPNSQDIMKVMSLGIMEPFPDGNFYPNKPITRANFAMAVQNLLAGLLKDPALTTRFIGNTSPFPDVPNSHYAFNAIMLVTTRGIMSAKIDGTFGLSDNVKGKDALLK